MAEVLLESYTINGGTYNGKPATNIILQPGLGSSTNHRDAGSIPFHVTYDIDYTQSTNETSVSYLKLMFWTNSSRTGNPNYTFNLRKQTGSGLQIRTNRVNTSIDAFSGLTVVSPTDGSALFFPATVASPSQSKTLYWRIVARKNVSAGFGQSAHTSDMTMSGNEGQIKIPAAWTFDSNKTKAEFLEQEWKGAVGSGSETKYSKLRLTIDPNTGGNAGISDNNISHANLRKYYANDIEVTIVRTNGSGSGNINIPNTWTSSNKLSFNLKPFNSMDSFEVPHSNPLTWTFDISVGSIVAGFWFGHTFDVKFVAVDEVGQELHEVLKTGVSNSAFIEEWQGWSNAYPTAQVERVAGAMPKLNFQLRSQSDSSGDSNSSAAKYKVEVRHSSSNTASVKQTFYKEGYSTSTGTLIYMGASVLSGSFDLTSSSIPNKSADKTLHITVTPISNDGFAINGDDKQTISPAAYDAFNWGEWHNDGTFVQLDDYNTDGVFIRIKPTADTAINNSGKRVHSFRIRRSGQSSPIKHSAPLDHGEHIFINKDKDGNAINILTMLENQFRTSDQTAKIRLRALNGAFGFLDNVESGEIDLLVPKRPEINSSTLTAGILSSSGVEQYTANGGTVQVGYSIEAHKHLNNIGKHPSKIKVEVGYYSNNSTIQYNQISVKKAGDPDGNYTTSGAIIDVSSANVTTLAGDMRQRQGLFNIEVLDFKRDSTLQTANSGNPLVVRVTPLDDKTIPGGYNTSTTAFSVKNQFKWGANHFLPGVVSRAFYKDVYNSEEVQIRALATVYKPDNSYQFFAPAKIRVSVTSDNNTWTEYANSSNNMREFIEINYTNQESISLQMSNKNDSTNTDLIIPYGDGLNSSPNSTDGFVKHEGVGSYEHTVKLEAIDSLGNVVDTLLLTTDKDESDDAGFKYRFSYVNQFFHINNFDYKHILDNEGRNVYIGEVKIPRTSFTGEDIIDKLIFNKGEVKLVIQQSTTAPMVADNWTTIHEEIILHDDDHSDRSAEETAWMNGDYDKKFLIRGPLSSNISSNTFREFRARIEHESDKGFFTNTNYTLWKHRGNIEANSTTPAPNPELVIREEFPASATLSTCTHFPYFDHTNNLNGKIRMTFPDANTGTSYSNGWGFAISGVIKEIVTANAINNAGEVGFNSRISSSFEKETTLDGATLGVATSGTQFDYVSSLIDEALYKSTIKLQITESYENQSAAAPKDWISIYNNNRNSASLVSIGEAGTPPTASNTYQNTREFEKTNVVMNNIEEFNGLLTPQPGSVSFAARDDGPGKFQKKRISFQLGSAMPNYFKNSNPRIFYGVNIMHKQTGNSNFVASDNLVCFKLDGSEFQYGPMSGLTGNQADINTKLSTIINACALNLRDKLTGVNVVFDANLSYKHSLYAYKDGNFDPTQDLYHRVIIFIEDSITNSAVSGSTPFNISPAGAVISNPSTWYQFGFDNQKFNLASTINSYGHLEDETAEDGLVDFSSLATLNSWSFSESPKTVTTVNLDYANTGTKKLPFSFSEEKVKYNYLGKHPSNPNVTLISGSSTKNPNESLTIGSNTKPKTLDTVHYVAEDDVDYTVTPVVFTATDFGAGAIVNSKELALPLSTVTTAQKKITNNYKEDFVPDYTNLAFTSGAEITVITPASGANGPSLRLSFKYNSTAFTDAEDYFQVAHENIKIMRTLEQSGTEYPTSNDSWSQVYNGNIFDIANKTDNGDGTHTFTIDDNLIDVSVIGGTFNPANTFKYKYRIFPSLNYTPGGAGATAKTADRTLSPQVSATMDSSGPLNLLDPVNIESVTYLDRHSAEVYWKYIHNDTLNTLKGFNDSADRTVNVKFKVYYKAADEKDFVYRNSVKETRPDNFERTIRKVKKEKDKFDSMRSSWIYSGFEQFDLNTDSEQKFYHNIEYNKVSFEYGIKVAILVVAEDSNNSPEVTELSHDITKVANLKGINTYGMTQFEETGLLVGPPEHMKIKKKFSDIELTGAKDIIARRKYEYDVLVSNLHQIPISITRKRAKTRLSNKPYTSST